MSTEAGDWQPTLDAVHQIPGTTYQQPAKKTFEELESQTQFFRRRYSADVAVGLGAVDDGDDFDPWAWLSDYSGGIADSITAHTEAIANLELVSAAVTTTPAYVSDIEDMATVPRFAVSSTAFGGSRPKFIDILTTPDVGGGGGAISVHYRVPATIRPDVVVGSSQGHIYYTPIVVDRNGTVGKMRWIVGADTSIFSIDYYEMALCVYNPANGNLEKVWGSGNIKDAEASTTTIGEVVIDMGISQTCQPGQILFAAHQQTAPGVLQTARRLAVAPSVDTARADTLLDACCYVAVSHSQGIPSSISFASLTGENRFIPWTSVSVTPLVEP